MGPLNWSCTKIAETETALQTKVIHERYKELSGLQRECVFKGIIFPLNKKQLGNRDQNTIQVYKKKVCLDYDTYYIK